MLTSLRCSLERSIAQREEKTENVHTIILELSHPTGAKANDAFLELVGYMRAEWRAEVERQDVPAPLLASFLRPEIVQRLQTDEDASPQESVIQNRDGKKLPVLIATTCLEQSDTCIGFVLDISERKDEFISIASHELKTPVTSLKGYLGLLRRLPP